MPTQRQIQIARRLAEELSRIILREVDDPRVRLVTITDVEVSPDLKHARVYFSVVGGPERPEEALAGLRRARQFIRRRLAEEADLRFTPSLQFHYDETAERAQRIEMLLRQVAEEREKREGESAADPTDPDDGDADYNDDP